MEQICHKTEPPPAFPTVFPGSVQLLSPWVGVEGGSLLFLVEYKVVQCQTRLKTTPSNQFVQFTILKYTLFTFKNYRKTGFQTFFLIAPT